jgi:hypothetical protein
MQNGGNHAIVKSIPAKPPSLWVKMLAECIRIRRTQIEIKQ